MSPERIDPSMFGLKDSRPTREADCYALGMVILEVLSGHSPFKGEHGNFVVTQKVINGERPERPQGAGRAWFTDDLWEVLGQCWSHQPGDRPTVKVTLEHLIRISAAGNAETSTSHDDGSSPTVSYPGMFNVASQIPNSLRRRKLRSLGCHLLGFSRTNQLHSRGDLLA